MKLNNIEQITAVQKAYIPCNPMTDNDTDPDPDDGLSPGIERRSTYFTTRTFTFGVNASF